VLWVSVVICVGGVCWECVAVLSFEEIHKACIDVVGFEGHVLNYSHSRTHPPRARPHGRTDEPKRPESHPTKECARARVRCLNAEPNYY
jgi:hypothetical protein